MSEEMRKRPIEAEDSEKRLDAILRGGISGPPLLEPWEKALINNLNKRILDRGRK